jgi:hypothetical protein
MLPSAGDPAAIFVTSVAAYDYFYALCDSIT